MRWTRQFLRDEDGTTAIEYSLVAGLISILIVTGASLIGSSLQTLFFGKLAASIP